jgi:hypothetical protein
MDLEMKTKKHHNVGTVLKSNGKIMEGAVVVVIVW